MISKINTDNDLMNRAAATHRAKVLIRNINWYVPHYTPNIIQQSLIKKHLVYGGATELRFVQRSVFSTELDAENECKYELGDKSKIDISIYIIDGIHNGNWRNNQESNNDVFLYYLSHVLNVF